jgi:hypothetical protein
VEVIKMVDKVDELIARLNRISKKLDAFSKAGFDMRRVFDIPSVGVIVSDIIRAIKNTESRLKVEGQVIKVTKFEIVIEGKLEGVSKEDFKVIERVLDDKRYWDVRFKETGKGVGVVEYRGGGEIEI